MDIGCGTSVLFHHIEEKVELIVGLDISRKLLDRARSKSRLSSKVSLICADAPYLSSIDETFDKVSAVTVLQNMPDAIMTLTRIIRTAKRDAVLIATGLKKSFTKSQFLGLLNEAPLNVVNLKGNGRLRGFVALCKKKVVLAC